MHYFFSDAHLGIGTRAEDRQKEQRIVAFLRSIRKDATSLYILGDLFDYWFEYTSVVPKGYVRLFGTLAELADSGVTITYLNGNHDFWMRGYLTEEMGITIEPDHLTIELDKQPFYLYHGDGLQKNDPGYSILKRVLRNTLNIRLFSLIHPDLATGISRYFSAKSRKRSSGKIFENNDMIGFASEIIMNDRARYVIMGHSHDPVYHPIGTGAYVNLGDWMRHNTYAVFDGTRLELKKWTG